MELRRIVEEPLEEPGLALVQRVRVERRVRLALVDEPRVAVDADVGGRDELSGGTWLAVNEHGVCAGLTNQPLGDAKDPSKRSRGELPLELARHASAACPA